MMKDFLEVEYNCLPDLWLWFYEVKRKCQNIDHNTDFFQIYILEDEINWWFQIVIEKCEEIKEERRKEVKKEGKKLRKKEEKESCCC